MQEALHSFDRRKNLKYQLIKNNTWIFWKKLPSIYVEMNNQDRHMPRLEGSTAEYFGDGISRQISSVKLGFCTNRVLKNIFKTASSRQKLSEKGSSP